MKAKQIQIGSRNEGEVFDDFIAAAEGLARGENVREEHGVYFTSLEAFRKAVTPKRLALLHLPQRTGTPEQAQHQECRRRCAASGADRVDRVQRRGESVDSTGQL